MEVPSFAKVLAQGSEESLFSVTPSGRVLSWDRMAEMLFGYSRAEAVGRPYLALLAPPEGVEVVAAALREAVRAGRARCEARLRRSDGTLLPDPLFLSLTATAGAGTVRFTVGRARDDPPAAAAEPPFVPAAVEVLPVGLGAEPELRQLRGQVHMALVSSFEPEVMARRVARLLVPDFADWCAVDLAAPGGLPERVDAIHRDGTKEPLLRRLAETSRDPAALASPALAIRSARALVATVPPPSADEPGHVRLLRELGAPSVLVVPLLGRIKVAGALTVAREGRGFTDVDLAWAEDLARRLALEIENARLADQAQRAREEARVAKERSQVLQDLAAAVSEALTPREVADVVVQEAREALGAAGGSVAILRDAATFEMVAQVGTSEVLSGGWSRFPIHARLPLADAGRSGEPVFVESFPEAYSRYPHLASTTGVASLLAVPLTVDGRRTGAIGLTWPERRDFGEADRVFARALARVCADALERARLYDAERAARAQASAAAHRSGLLAEASRMLATSFDYEATLRGVARLVVPSIADWCAIHVLDRDGIGRTLALVHADPAKAPLAERLAALRPDLEGAGVGKALATGKREVYFDIPLDVLPAFAPEPERRELLAQLGMRATMVLPLLGRGQVLGAIALSHSTGRRFATEDLALAEELAGRVALALDNARLYHDAHESEERYRLLIEGVQDHAFFMLDVEGRIVNWTAAAERLHGHRAEDVLGRSHAILHPPDDAAGGKPQADLRRALAEGRFEEEGWRMRQDGSRFWANVLVTVVRDEEGVVQGFSQLIRDLTERRKSAEVIEQARQQVAVSEKLSTMGTLVSGVAHEVRTPLTAISNSLHGLRFRLETNRGKPLEGDLAEAMRARVEAAIEGVDRINHLVEDLRRFHALNPKDRARVGLHRVVGEALNLFQVAYRGRVEVIARLDETPLCSVDRIQLQQIVLNLLQNASEAMPHGGRVWLDTREEAGEALIVVRDEGAGMPEEVRARMFEEFFTTKPGGTGLGLSIVRRIVEEHGARIECDTTLGHGTRFKLWFPPA